MSNFHPLEVVGRGSETLLQVGENKLIQQDNLMRRFLLSYILRVR